VGSASRATEALVITTSAREFVSLRRAPDTRHRGRADKKLAAGWSGLERTRISSTRGTWRDDVRTDVASPYPTDIAGSNDQWLAVQFDTNDVDRSAGSEQSLAV